MKPRIPPLALVALLAMLGATMACTFGFRWPITRLRTGPTETKDISVDVPEGEGPVDVILNFAAGRLKIRPGPEDGLIQGTAMYNVRELEPEVFVSGSDVRISQEIENVGIPSIGSHDLVNEWDLTFAPVPMRLEIAAGAYEGEFELGGLALADLDIRDGAAQVELTFDEPNTVVMDTLRYQTGASEVTMTKLANANFERMDFNGGAGDYTLDFSGELSQDARVSVGLGVSSLTIIVPEGTPARISMQGALTDVDLSGAWRIDGDEYYQDGEGPSLDISINMAAGSLTLGN